MLKLEPHVVEIPLGEGFLSALFCEPVGNHPLVIFAHGSGSSRLSPRNQHVADELTAAGFGTLLLDLLSEEEDFVYENRFDIPLLAKRLLVAVRWAKPGHVGARTPLAFFGASTGAAAALIAAADLDGQISAVVSRGGRPDLAFDALARVQSPTLLIVGELDLDVLRLNRQALGMLPETTKKELVVIPGATHLFEEPGTLRQAAQLARDWFAHYAVIRWRSPAPTRRGATTMSDEALELSVRSEAFVDAGRIADLYAGAHDNRSPQLAWSLPTSGGSSVAIVCEDPDAPRERPFVHWLVANLPPRLASIPSAVPTTASPECLEGGIQGTNDVGKVGWFGPRPPVGHGVHHYHFRVLLLDQTLDLKAGFHREEFDRAIRGHVLARGEIVGTYERPTEG